jgi:hypothetical protein
MGQTEHVAQMKAEQLTEWSIQHNGIARTGDEAVLEELKLMSDDWTDANDGIVETWGTDDEGNEWRVHYEPTEREEA